MKKVLFILVVFLMSSAGFSQVLTQRFEKGEVVKKGVKVKRKTSSSNIIEMPQVDVEKLLKEDAEMAGGDYPYRFGYGFDVSYSLDDGEWEDTDDGRLWSLSFKSSGAHSLNFVIQDLFLPDGAYLNIVNSDNSIVYGPVTASSIPEDSYFLTDVIPDSMVTLYLFEPKSQEGNSVLCIKKVVHGYRNFYTVNDQYGNVNSSADCNIPVEDAFPEYETEANAIALILLEDGTSLCSGSLIMSTDLSYKSYILTAFHCLNTELISGTVEPTDMTLSSNEVNKVNHWLIKFGYREQSTYAITFNGANFRAGWFNSDFALVELYENAKQFAHLTWLGWDRTGGVPSSGVCIHHPVGDYMKISTDVDPSQSSPYSSCFYPSYMTPHWVEHWESGIVQGGSSGSPLLNQNKRVVGQLHGVVFEQGHNINTPPCEINYGYYGKLNLSWTGGGNSSTRLSDWLDPNNTGKTTINSSHPLYLSGPDIACNSSIYYVENLSPNSDYNATWSFQNSTSLNSLITANSPATNQCTINNPSHLAINDILVASIYRSGQLVTTLKKHIKAYNTLSGTYTQVPEAHNKYGYSTFTKTLYEDGEIFVNPACDITINSQNFQYMTVTSSNSSITLNVQPTSVGFSVPYNSGISHFSINASSTGGCNDFSILVHVMKTALHSLDVAYLENEIQLTLSVEGENLLSSAQTLTKNADQPVWDIEIVNALTGKVVYSGQQTDSQLNIDTTGWDSGVYIIRVTIGEEIITKKISIR